MIGFINCPAFSAGMPGGSGIRYSAGTAAYSAQVLSWLKATSVPGGSVTPGPARSITPAP